VNLSGRIPTRHWAAAAVSGVLQVLIFPLASQYWLAWMALVPLLWSLLAEDAQQVLAPGEAATGRTPMEGFWLGYVSGIVFYCGSCSWIYRTMYLYGEMARPVAAGILLLFGLYLGLYHAAFGALLIKIRRKGGVKKALLVTPFLWVAVELARARITGFPWDLLGYAQVENVVLTRLATLTGVYGLSFVIAAVNAIFCGWALRPARRRTGIVALLLATGLQALTLVKFPATPTTHTAVLVQGNIPILDGPQWTTERFDKTVQELEALSRVPVTASEPRLIVWPESPAPFFYNDPRLRASLAQLAGAQRAFLIVGSLGTADSGQLNRFLMYNSATLIAPDGSMPARYDKVHLVPFGEYVPFRSLFFFAEKLTREVSDFTAGKSRDVFVLAQGAVQRLAHPEPGGMAGMVMPGVIPQKGLNGKKVGTFICYESIFPDEVRDFALNGAEVFVNISNDGWYGHSGAPVQHLNMARMRAIENGRWLLRDTNTGVTASIDPYGRIVAQAPRDQQTALAAPYAYASGLTFYTRHGDWFPWLCAIIAAAFLFVRFTFRGGTLS